MDFQATFSNQSGQAKTLDIKDGFSLQDAYNVVANDDFAPTQITLEAINMNSSYSNVEPDKQVETAYDLIGRHSSNDIIDKHKISSDELAILLEEGTNHELEHTSSYLIAMKIAQDHLYEDLMYYSKLKEAMLARGAAISMSKDKPQYEYDNKFKDGGIIAPNGKASNLTQEQYKMVRTPEFKAWFGDWENDPENASKVVDENGEPLVVYHGAEIMDKKTNGVFNLFKAGSYFTDTYKSAVYYAFKLAYGIDDVKKEDTEIYCVFLNIRNPKKFDYQNDDAEYHFHDFYEGDERISEYMQQGYDGLIWEYDFKMHDMSIKQKEKHFINFYPNQIKLADGTNTTFDGKNPDIRFDKGGYVSEDVLIENNIGKIDDIYVFSEDDKPVKSLGEFTLKGFGKFVMKDLAAELYDDYKIRLRSDFAIMLQDDVIKPSIKVAQMKNNEIELLAIIYNALVTDEDSVSYVYNEDGEVVGKFTDEDFAEDMVNNNDGYYSEVRVEEVSTPETILAMQFDFNKHEMNFVSSLLEKQSTHKFKYGGKL